jgi:hypothetical protein
VKDDHFFDESAVPLRFSALEADLGQGTIRPITAVDPDWSAILAGLGELADETELEAVRVGMAEALKRLLQILLYDRKGRLLPAQAAGVRAQALAYTFGLVDGATLQELAQPSDLTRAAVSKVVGQFSRRFEKSSRSMKRPEAREIYADRARRVHRQKKEKVG